MKNDVANGILLAALLTGSLSLAARGSDEIRAGKWQFTTQMQMPVAAQTQAGAQARPGGTPNMTRTACIDASNPVPKETQQGNIHCKVDRVERNADAAHWSM